MLTNILADISLGLSVAVSWENLLFCFIGVTLGTLLGALPGIGVLAAISMLFPVTFHLPPLTALIMLAGIYYGTSYGGSIASIILNLPGTPSNAVACLDGYPLAKQGRAAMALFMTAVASFIGGSIGIIILMAFSPLIVHFALEFGPPEYFSLMLMGLMAASVISSGSAVKSIAMVVFGIIIGLIGTDVYTGAQRFTFGSMHLMDGVSLVALAMGLFGLSEVVVSIRSVRSAGVHDVRMRSMMPKRDELRRSWMPILRGTTAGSFFGALPGTGGTIAAFMSYAVEKKIAKDPSRFGKGAIEGLVSPEAANNAADQTAFIPTLTLGIPGTAGMALMLGVLMIHGIAPGPMLMTDHPDIFWGLIMSFWIGNLMLLILNIPMISLFVRILTMPFHILYPAILMFICIGVYTISNSVFDIVVVVVFGALGYAMRLLDFPAAPLLLGFVLGPLMEENFRRAMLLSRGSFDIFIAGSLNTSFMLITLGLFIWAIWSALRDARRAAEVARDAT